MAANIGQIETGGEAATLMVDYAGFEGSMVLFVDSNGTLIKSDSEPSTGQYAIPVPSIVFCKTKNIIFLH